MQERVEDIFFLSDCSNAFLHFEHAMPAPSLHPAGSPTVVPETTTENCIFQCAPARHKKKGMLQRDLRCALYIPSDKVTT